MIVETDLDALLGILHTTTQRRWPYFHAHFIDEETHFIEEAQNI